MNDFELTIPDLYFYHLLQLSSVSQGVPVANKCQMSSDINFLYHSYQEWLKYQTSLHSRVKFMFLV